MTSIRTIVVPHDFSEYADAALEVALELGGALDADLHLLHVLQPPAYAYGSEPYVGASVPGMYETYRERRESQQERLSAIASRVDDQTRPIRTHLVEGTRVSEAIDLEAAHLTADLIIMGTHGRTGLSHLLLGSVAEATLRHAPCPVLTVPLKKRIHVDTLRTMAEREPASGVI